MKISHACIVAAIFLFITIIAAFMNSHYLDNTASYIINAIDALPEDPLYATEKLMILKTFWEERRKILSFTMSDTSLDSISLLFDETIISINNYNKEEYQKATARLKRAVESIRELEKVSPDTIF